MTLILVTPTDCRTSKLSIFIMEGTPPRSPPPPGAATRLLRSVPREDWRVKKLPPWLSREPREEPRGVMKSGRSWGGASREADMQSNYEVRVWRARRDAARQRSPHRGAAPARPCAPYPAISEPPL